MISNETREKWNDKFTTVTRAINNGSLILSEWESDFIQSIGIKVSGRIDLTMRQSVVLNTIYSKIS